MQHWQQQQVAATACTAWQQHCLLCLPASLLHNQLQEMQLQALLLPPLLLLLMQLLLLIRLQLWIKLMV
jgi:hypothetical protein